MKKLFFILTFFTATAAFSQYYPPSLQWQVDVGSNGDDSFWDIVATADGGSVTVGSTNGNNFDISGNHGGFDILVVKYSSTGAVEWKKCYGGTAHDYGYSIQQTVDGGYIVGGQSFSSDGDLTNNRGSADAWVFKLNNIGTIEWQKNYGTNAGDQITSIQVTIDGGYIFTGVAGADNGDVTGGGFHGGASDVWVVKLSVAGIVEWQKCYGSSHIDVASDIKQTSDGGYVFAGYARTNDGDVTGVHIGPDPNREDWWVVKITNTGIIQWQKAYGGGTPYPTGFGDDRARSVQQTTDGGYIIVGYVTATDGDITNYHGGISDGWVVKLNSLGVLEWQKTLGGSSGEVLNKIIKHPDGGYVICGETQSGDGDLQGVPNAAGGINSWMLKLSNTGTIQWQKIVGATNYDVFRSVALTADNGFVASGSVSNNDYDAAGNNYRGNGDGWTVKFSAQVLPITLVKFFRLQTINGNEIHWQTVNENNFSHFELEKSADGRSFHRIATVAGKAAGGTTNYHYIDDTYSTPKQFYRLKMVDKDGRYSYSTIIILNKDKEFSFKVSPNPFTHIIFISSLNSVNNINIYDSKGKLVLHKKGDNLTTINTSILPAGAYVLQAYTANGQKHTIELIK